MGFPKLESPYVMELSRHVTMMSARKFLITNNYICRLYLLPLISFIFMLFFLITPDMSGSFFVSHVSCSSYFQNELVKYGNNLSFGHLNCQSIRPSCSSNKLDEIANILVDSTIDLFAISETWMKSPVSTKSVSISGYDFVRNDRPARRGGGVGIYISKKLRYRTIFRSDCYGECESLFIEVVCGSEVVLFGVVYLPHGNFSAFASTHETLLSSYAHIIIVGDFNRNLFNISHSSFVRSACFGLGLTVSHNSLPTHYDSAHNSCSLIDYVLLSEPDRLMHSSQAQCASISHHALIYGSYRAMVSRSDDVIEYRDYRLIDWDKFFDCLTSFNYESIYTTSDVDHQLSIINDLVNRLFTCVPVVRRRMCRRKDSWMRSREVILARSLMDLAHMEFRKNPTEENGRIFRIYRNRCKLVMRRAKRNHNIREFDVTEKLFHVDPNYHRVLMKMTNSRLTAFLKRMLWWRFRELNQMLSEYIVHIFNSIFTTSTYPAAWKLARVVPVPKSGESSNVENFRPISILPALSKIFEYIMNDFIQHYVNGHNLISSHQLLLSYLSGRSQYVSLGGFNSSVRPITCGVPQGSILAPLLFILFINDIANYIHHPHCIPYLYADDIHLLFIGSSISDISALANSVLVDVENWVTLNGLDVNSSKSKAMCFLTGRGVQREPEIVFGGVRISIVDEMKCLGVVLDCRLDFGTHINCIRSRIIFTLRRLYSLNTFLPRYVRERVASALLMSHIYYCLEVVSGTSNANLVRIELNRIQANAGKQYKRPINSSFHTTQIHICTNNNNSSDGDNGKEPKYISQQRVI
ncbi:uncharacterized protein LOC142235352 [Haematobia irritans]|uniref:uncharacterized protein LOC142235352 n=1 Tax=Haematobia irritans TaxID=7368 RepID=UPI003F509BB6